MKVVKEISRLREEIRDARHKDKTIGLVPTMGFLHQGHLSLVRKSVSDCGFTVVSIFVNPTQFGESEDYGTYPRDIQRDLNMLRKGGVDLVFEPSVEEMYSKDAETCVVVEKLSVILEGRFRPGHFNGVCTIVCKLFNAIMPDRAYFGWKDAQQLVIIKKMTRDLNMPVEVIGCPTVREKDGLAASSRNIHIREEDRGGALCLYKGLKKIEEMFLKDGVRDSSVLIQAGKEIIKGHSGVQLQYLEIVESEGLTPVERIKGRILVLGAIKLPSVRLIDNLFLSDKMAQ